MMNDKVMEILKEDKKSVDMMALFHNTAIEQGLDEDEYADARKTMLMLIISQNSEAMECMAHEVYDHFNA